MESRLAWNCARNGLKRPLGSLRAFSSSAAASNTEAVQTPEAPVAPPPYYPFARNIAVYPAEAPKVPLSKYRKTQNNVLSEVNSRLSAFVPPHLARIVPYFARRHPQRILPGSVLTVDTWTQLPTAENPEPPFTTFSGVLMGIYRKGDGMGTSFRLRNVIDKAGVEIRFELLSPTIKHIHVVLRPTAKGRARSHGLQLLRRERRVKLYYFRKRPDRLVNVEGVVRTQQRLRDQRRKDKEERKKAEVLAEAREKKAKLAQERRERKEAAGETPTASPETPRPAAVTQKGKKKAPEKKNTQKFF
ncbi:hypothetical protein BT69DRAFT_1256243 [Atractiella rhizophila]|nr:hypothetical protein BT69DRAFT_1256243 [Atractiella rhizophila]